MSPPARQIKDRTLWPFATEDWEDGSPILTVVDLSSGLWAGMPRYPSPYLEDVAITSTATHEVEKRRATTLKFGSHIGTHLDAPCHMAPEGASLETVPLSQLAGSARLARLPERDFLNPITAADLCAAGIPSDVEKLLLDTGWAEHNWKKENYWREGPHLAPDAVDYLLNLPRLHLLGLDAPNVDAAADTVMGRPAPAHYKLLSRGLVILETLLSLALIPEEFFLVVAPLRISGGDGCPCRPLAFFPSRTGERRGP